MTTRFPLALGVAGMIGATALVGSLSADAQQPPAPPAPNTTTQSQSPAAPRADANRPFEGQRMSPGDRAAFFDARVAGVHAGLQLTPDQEKLWPPVESAVRDAAKTMRDMREARRNEEAAANPIDRLERVSQRQIARGEAFKKVADAAGPLYAALNDEQKHRLPMLLRPLRDRHQHMAMMEHRHWRDGDREERGGWRRFDGPMGDGPHGWDRGERGGGDRGWRNDR